MRSARRNPEDPPHEKFWIVRFGLTSSGHRWTAQLRSSQEGMKSLVEKHRQQFPDVGFDVWEVDLNGLSVNCIEEYRVL